MGMSERLMQGALWWLEDSSQQVSGLWLSRSHSSPTCWVWAAEMQFAKRYGAELALHLEWCSLPIRSPSMAQMGIGMSDEASTAQCASHQTSSCPALLPSATSGTPDPLFFLPKSNTFLLQGLSTSCLLCSDCFSSTHPLGSLAHSILVSAQTNLRKVFPDHFY